MFKDNLKQARKNSKLTQKQIAEILKVSDNSVSNWEKGVSRPDIEQVSQLCKILKVSADILLDNELEVNLTPDEFVTIKKYRSLNHYSKKAVDGLLDNEYERCTYRKEIVPIEMPMSLYGAAAGTGNWLDEEYNVRVKVKDTPEARRANIVIRVSGNSMEPKFSDGDKVLVKIQPDIEVGEIGIFIVDNEGYIKQKGEHELISLNPEYDNISIGEYTEYRCFGKVLGKAEIIEE